MVFGTYFLERREEEEGSQLTTSCPSLPKKVAAHTKKFPPIKKKSPPFRKSRVPSFPLFPSTKKVGIISRVDFIWEARGVLCKLCFISSEAPIHTQSAVKSFLHAHRKTDLWLLLIFFGPVQFETDVSDFGSWF